MKNFLIRTTAVGLGFCLWSGAAIAKPAPPNADTKAASHVTMGEKSWIGDVYNSGLEEISLGKLAATKGTTAGVKELGSHMMSGHQALNKELKMLADKKGVKISQKSADKEYKKLNALKGKDFDKEYVKMMVDGHTGIVKKFKSEADKGNDPNLKAWAAANLPKIEEHLKMAQAQQAAVGK